MSTITRIDPPIEIDTPRGKADAHFLIDYSADDNLVWVCFIRGSGECWSYRNPLIRKTWCETMGTGRRPDPVSPSVPNAPSVKPADSVKPDSKPNPLTGTISITCGLRVAQCPTPTSCTQRGQCAVLASRTIDNAMTQQEANELQKIQPWNNQTAAGRDHGRYMHLPPNEAGLGGSSQ